MFPGGLLLSFELPSAKLSLFCTIAFVIGLKFSVAALPIFKPLKKDKESVDAKMKIFVIVFLLKKKLLFHLKYTPL
ncbi:hypothetical protein M2E15_0100 [Bacillus mycoides]|nr:hypothetical protein M2E15_0100 [Bacillus mycoides]KZE06493.1 hypothetical protein B4117_1896 [Bacillus mycoides]OSY10231.1 hypothetical protein BTJ48_02021 [Bacillus mycoides]